MTRNERIISMYEHGGTRKAIAWRIHSKYDTVKKVIQKYVGPERRACERIQVVRRSIQIAII